MLDAATFTALVRKHSGVVYLQCTRLGFRGEDLNDLVHEVWADLWEARSSWPAGGPENVLAFVRAYAARTALDIQRGARALKRDGITVSISAGPWSEPSGAPTALGLACPPEQEEAYDNAQVERALRSVAGLLSEESEAVILGRLDDAPEPTKRAAQRALRHMRRALDLPADSLATFVSDPAEHVIRAARRAVPLRGDDLEITQEMPCEADTWMNRPGTDSPTSAARPRCGAPAAPPTATPAEGPRDQTPTSRACARTPWSRSRQQPSASARSRRRERCASTTAPTPTAPLWTAKRPEPTVLTSAPWAMDEAPSTSGSRA
ncbi:MAG: hypothetical protein HYS27_03155 [Deltaproteobacteria bacterium]|nr:hypothetical protein [Deltaproteobacteria bacterium]